MVNLDESQLYNLMNRGGVIYPHEVKNIIAAVMVLHLHHDHGYGPRKIAQSLKLKQKDVTALLKMHEEEQ